MGEDSLPDTGTDGEVMNKLTFEELHNANQDRLPLFEAAFGMGPRDWSLGDWGCALAGEVGELCNLIKKRRRGQDIPKRLLAQELADVIIYASLLANEMAIDLGQTVQDTFNAKSDELGISIKLESSPE